MKSWLAVLAILVASAVGAFAVYTFGWHDNENGRATKQPQSNGGRRVITLHNGDVVLRPQAATRCEASGEGGRPNLFCTRIGGGRHQVIFYGDAVLVWPLDCAKCGPDGPVFTYSWKRKPSR
jgi:hypothetical protein